MEFADIHAHVLYEIDDGAEDIDEMYSLIDAEYAEGVRWLCCTPHFHPGYYGNNSLRRDILFEELRKGIEIKYPDLKLYLGNELHFYDGCMEEVKKRECLTINNTRYLLVDFDFDVALHTMEVALKTILQRGYVPVLAHVERYNCFRGKWKQIKRLRESGVFIQVNASSIAKRKYYLRIRYMMINRIVDIVASDAHNLKHRPPVLKEAYIFVSKKYGVDYALEVFKTNPYKLLENM